MPPGNIWATRNKGTVGSSPRRSWRRNRRPRGRSWRTSTGSRSWKSCARAGQQGCGEASEGRAGLAEVTDPRAVPMIWAIFVRGGERQQIAAVQMLGQIDGPFGVERAGRAGGLQSGGRGAAAGDRNLETARSPRRRRAVDRSGSQALQVPGAACQRPGSAGLSCSSRASGSISSASTRTRQPRRLDLGRIYTPDVPFDPFSVRNLILATVPSFITNPLAGISAQPHCSPHTPSPFRPRVRPWPGKQSRPTRNARRS